MYRILGNAVSRFWPFWLVGWIVILIGLRHPDWATFGLVGAAPKWDDVVEDGEFAFLPASAPSRRGEERFHEAFPDDLLASVVVIVVRREANPDGLLPRDEKFIEEILKPRLEKIADEKGPIIAKIRTSTDGLIGRLLVSEDKKASLVIVGLTSEFLERRNGPIIDEIEQLIGPNGELRRKIPPGLDLRISGSATVGRDMRQAAQESADATELWTVVLVMILLILIYRAPILSLIPLATVALSVTISLSILALLSQAGLVNLFAGIEIYVTILTYGAGVDYCLFEIARYKEELDAGATFDEAVTNVLAKVGAALSASAGTVMCGIGMMVFAQFGKFQQAGVAIAFSLFICLCSALTFTPALLRLSGRWAFWPKMRSERISATRGWIASPSLLARLIPDDVLRKGWAKTGRILLDRPLTIWLVSIALMLPFAAIGVAYYNYLSYGLLSELPQNDPSAVGAKAVQQHFPAGTTGPLTLLLESPDVDFDSNDGIKAIEDLTRRIDEQKETLKIADIRSAANPFGTTKAGRETAEKLERELSMAGRFKRFATTKIRRKRTLDYYVSNKDDWKGHVTRIDVIFKDDPFSRDSISQMETFQERVEDLLPPLLQRNSTLLYVGPTASIRDLKTTIDQDQIRIDVLVLSGVFLILVVLLRRPAISAYLIVSVFFSYLVTLGVTFTVFWLLDPAGFSGLDWKVSMFLFTILIAVGEDYNIFLMTRIAEEQKRYGPLKGITAALEKTGSIISSCGFIMAGTFSSLAAGTLVGMHQLGFALAFGVLLDTFVVRPILVPTYLMLLHSGRFGNFGKLLGAGQPVKQPKVPVSLRTGPDR